MRCAVNSNYEKEEKIKANTSQVNIYFFNVSKTPTEIVTEDMIKSRKIGMLRAIHREIMKLIFKSKAKNVTDYNILKELIYKHLDELEYSDREVSLS